MYQKNSIGFKKSCILLTLCSMLYAFFAASTFAADKLVVRDSSTTSTNTLYHGIEDGNHARGTQDAYGSGKYHVLAYRIARGSEIAPEIVQNGDLVFDFRGQAYDGQSFYNVAVMRMAVDGTPGTHDMPGRLMFFTTPDGSTSVVERMRIDSAGNMGIGEPNPQHLLHLKNGAYSDGYTWETASSREYKENIKDLAKGEALFALNKLNPVTFNYKTDQEKNHVGFIAEDVPDLVASKDRKGLSPMDIVAVLTKVVQEQQRIISNLSDKVNRLEKLIK